MITPDGNDILKIGSVAWDDVDLKCRLEYLRPRTSSKVAAGPKMRLAH
jgi:hypothetical protein